MKLEYRQLNKPFFVRCEKCDLGLRLWEQVPSHKKTNGLVVCMLMQELTNDCCLPCTVVPEHYYCLKTYPTLSHNIG